MQYAGFWRRLGAFFLDILFTLPLAGIMLAGLMHTRWFYLLCFLPGMAFALWYNVYLVEKFGATPGQRLLKLRVAMLDGSAVTRKAAVLRYCVLFLMSQLMAIAGIIACARVDGTIFPYLNFTARTQHIALMMPGWSALIYKLVQIWIWSEFIVLLFNQKRRGLQDYMAGTVVVKTAGAARPGNTAPINPVTEPMI